MAYVCPPNPGDPTEFSDALSAPTAESLLPSVLAQTPRGPAWRTDETSDGTNNSYIHRFFRAVCDPLASLYARIWTLMLSSTAATVADESVLADWEREFGLPEPCLGGAELSIDQRKKLLRERVANEGSQSIGAFKCLAARLGYTITIDETRLFRCGQSRCGSKHRVGPPVHEVAWRVNVPTPTVSFFRSGSSRCGRDPLRAHGRKKDLECMFQKLKPAHTRVVFNYVYTGAAPPPFA